MTTSPLQLDELSPPGPVARWVWAVGGTLYVGAATAVAARSGLALTPLPWIAAAHAVSLSIVCAVTALLLYAHAQRAGGRGYLALSSTFATVAILQFAVPLTFPGAFVEGSLLGGAQSSITIFYLWNLVALLGIPLSALLLRQDASIAHRADPPRGAWTAIVVGLVPGLLLVVWVTLLPGLLPPLVADGETAGLAHILDRVLLLAAVVGLVVVVWATRGATAIGRWLVAVATLGLGSAIVNVGAERFSLGWYFNRSLGLLMMSLLLLALVGEMARVDRSTYAVAARDSLTGASSRLVFENDVAREVRSALTSGTTVALMCLDLDRFKEVNDDFGHPTGDALLVDVVRRVLGEVRSSDLVGRMGGDEFGVLLTHVGSYAAAEVVARRVVEKLRMPFGVDGVLVYCPCSVGVAFLPDDATTATELFRHADAAMYLAKDHGGNQVRFFQELRALTREAPVAPGSDPV
jgi:diguanylate cyclase (GGDEF)-like protein